MRKQIIEFPAFLHPACIFFSVLLLVPYEAAGQLTARSLGMGGAYTALARGVHAAVWNPANLGLPDNPRFSFTIISAGSAVWNNSYNLALYEKYNGEYWSEEDIKDILGHIPDEGLGLDADAAFRALSFSVRNFALTVGGTVGSYFTLDKELFQLGLMGNEIGETYRFQDIYGEGIGVGRFSLSWGQAVPVSFADALSLGCTLHMLIAASHGRTDKAVLSLSTMEDYLAVDGDYELTYAYLGKIGLGLDLGAAARLGDRWTIGLAVCNVLGSLRWDGDVYKEVGFMVSDSMTVFDFLDDDKEVEDFISDSTWSVDGMSYSTRLPLFVRAGAAAELGSFLLAADVVQGFGDEPMVSTRPRFSLGMEWRGVRWLPLRMGLIAGGRVGLGVSFGLGLRPGGFFLDIGMINRGLSMGKKSKGMMLGFEIGIDLQKTTENADRRPETAQEDNR